jgi:hypothetical protein
VSTLWPFAVDWFARDDRLMIFGDVPVEHGSSGSTLLLPTETRLAIDETVGVNLLTLVALVSDRDESGEVVRIHVKAAPDAELEAAVFRLTAELTQQFVSEVPAARLDGIVRDALIADPSLTDIDSCFERLVSSISYSDDPTDPTSSHPHAVRDGRD